jgi:hypothetical protein
VKQATIEFALGVRGIAASMLSGFLLIAVVAELHAGSLDTMVASKYPADLTAFSAKYDYEEQRQQAYVEVSSGGTSYVVAAYSSGEIGAVVLLEKSGDGYRVDQEMSRETGQMIGDIDPEVTALDVDADGAPEVIARYTVGMKRAAEGWVFRISGGHLQLISPTTKEGASILGYGHFLDLTGSGALDIIDDAALKNDKKYTFFHPRYVLHDGSYVAADPVDYYEVFYRGDGAPVTVTRTVTIATDSLQKRPKLVIVNGDALGVPYRVASGKVTINGVTVSPQQDFSQPKGTWIVPVTLLPTNTITVWLDGKPASRIAVVILHE